MGYIHSNVESPEVLSAAWHRALNLRSPCDCCGKQQSHHHATCDGVNLCHDCYRDLKPCVQVYPGDRGGPPMFFPGPAVSGGQ